ncbi:MULTISPECIES: N-acetylmuramoyl-L-alanine amidase family protein [Bhargavaea]|uniref:N-acetylmuramoyl-L-alanine amidase n=1 Tax=Bhargavaea changchunensis TaxID=2134037 RepID=A0ABW2NJA6_9BACL|nr:N-acetylmuramoyl-L-alanine amidase [Bhargavaea sp. CC-171006]
MKKIMLDAGHGPTTPGKRTPDGSMLEFAFNTSVSAYAEKLLKAEGITVMTAHASGRDVPLAERVRKANSWGADAYISIHANAYGTGWNEANGIETYIYPRAQRQSELLAGHVQAALVSATGRRNRGVKRANFAVVRETRMPAVLLECGFMTNRTEAGLLKNDRYRRQCARAIAFAVINWYYGKGQ